MKFSVISIASLVSLALAANETIVTETNSTMVTITSCEGGCSTAPANVSSFEAGVAQLNQPFGFAVGGALAAGALLAL